MAVVVKLIQPSSGEEIDAMSFNTAEDGWDILAWLRSAAPVEGIVKQSQNSEEPFLRLTRGTQRVYFHPGGWMTRDKDGNFHWHKDFPTHFEVQKS